MSVIRTRSLTIFWEHLYPGTTRWNSLYDAMCYVLENRAAFMSFDINARSQEKNWVVPEGMTYGEARLTHEDWMVLKQAVSSLHVPTTLRKLVRIVSKSPCTRVHQTKGRTTIVPVQIALRV